MTRKEDIEEYKRRQRQTIALEWFCTVAAALMLSLMIFSFLTDSRNIRIMEMVTACGIVMNLVLARRFSLVRRWGIVVFTLLIAVVCAAALLLLLL